MRTDFTIKELLVSWLLNFFYKTKAEEVAEVVIKDFRDCGWIDPNEVKILKDKIEKLEEDIDFLYQEKAGIDI